METWVPPQHCKSLITAGSRSSLLHWRFNPTAHNKQWHEVCAYVQGPLAKDAATHFNLLFNQEGRTGLSELSLSSPELFEPLDLPPCEASLFYTQPGRKNFGLTRMVFELIERAQQSIWIENGYIAYRPILEKLCEAKKRGVKDIRIIAPHQSNHSSVDRRFRTWIPTLQHHGIEIYLYPEMTHAKVMMVDDQYLSVGSLNFEELSFLLNNELNIVAFDPSGGLATQAKEKIFLPDVQKSTRVV
ncbi:MAG: phospholipase D-like domain-containing protein [Bdellovibrionota bacterium]